MSEHLAETDVLSDLRTYEVEAPTERTRQWLGTDPEDSRSVGTPATSAPTGAHAPMSTPATTSAPGTRPTDAIDPRHIGCCAGGRRSATSDGACPICGYVGKVSRHGVVPHHRDRRRVVTPPG